MKTVFLRVLEAEDKAAALLAAIREPNAPRDRQRFDVDPASFTAVPRSPFAYWVTGRLRRLFQDLPQCEAQGRSAKQGLSTADDYRFARLAWEPLSTRSRLDWPDFAKGGMHSRYYSDIHLVANWLKAGREIYVANGIPVGLAGAPIRNPEYYGRCGLTWPRRTQGGLSLRAMPSGCIFADKGPAAFVEGNGSADLLALLAITNAQAFRALVDLQMAFGSYEVGVIQRTPVPRLSPSDGSTLAVLARRAWALKRSLDTHTETSHAFTLPALLQAAGDTLAARTDARAEHVRGVEAELAAIQAEIDARCFDLYGIDEADRRAITEGFGSSADASDEPAETDADADAEPEDDSDDESSADAAGLAAELVSWTVGVAFGRFDVRLATGVRELPPEPEPFDPLPVCSPGMLTGDDGLPLARPPAGYSLAFPENGVLVDDAGHARDLTAAVRAVFDTVFGASADAWWSDTAALLDAKSHDLRAWLAVSFFEHHLKRHSRSRRKAPILWQLATPSGRYSVWLYAHRLTRDSFFQLQSDVIAPKLLHEERQLDGLRQGAGSTPSAEERKQLAAQEALVEELRTMLDEVKRVTPLWNPTLDDGVVLTMAPLWRLVPQHKPWQKELKTKWDELCAGRYDWAHVALHLWPERVIPKCAQDRSLAIAHGLEDVFWCLCEDDSGKWQRRETPTRSVDELVRERTSPAVKAALASLLEAPSPGGPAKRTRKGRSDA